MSDKLKKASLDYMKELAEHYKKTVPTHVKMNPNYYNTLIKHGELTEVQHNSDNETFVSFGNLDQLSGIQVFFDRDTPTYEFVYEE